VGEAQSDEPPGSARLRLDPDLAHSP
jgi:hypothetical protein